MKKPKVNSGLAYVFLILTQGTCFHMLSQTFGPRTYPVKCHSTFWDTDLWSESIADRWHAWSDDDLKLDSSLIQTVDVNALLFEEHISVPKGTTHLKTHFIQQVEDIKINAKSRISFEKDPLIWLN